jgi:Domain of Unknown Function (DUF928)
MSNRQYFLTLALCGLSLCMEPLLLNNSAAKVQAQTTAKVNVQKNRRFIGFKPPGQSQPNYTIGAATRSNGQVCQSDRVASERTLTALVSSADKATTVRDRPTFLVYVPKTSAKQATLIVKDASEGYFYEKTFSLPKKPGIVSIDLPKNAPTLQNGKKYSWSVVLVCGQSTRPNDPFVTGIVTKTKNSQLSTKLEKASLLDRANAYQKNLIWYDTLATVAKLTKIQPGNLEALHTWQKLLEEVNLSDLATEPLMVIK